jgi:hypothetical protein
MPEETYSTFPFGPKFPLFVFGLGILIDVASIDNGRFWFSLVWNIGWICGAYVFTWVIVSELTITDEILTWRAALRSGQVRTSDIRDPPK